MQTVKIVRLSDGFHADVDLGLPGWTFASTSFVVSGNHVSFNFFNDKTRYRNINTGDGDLDPATRELRDVWHWTDGGGRLQTADFDLHRTVEPPH